MQEVAVTQSAHDVSGPDYHGHPNYVAIWAALVVLLGLSLAASSVSKFLAVVIIFTIAVIKAVMVAGSFMHLRWEPRVLWGIVLAAVLCVAFFYVGVYPDIVAVKPEVVR